MDWWDFGSSKMVWMGRFEVEGHGPIFWPHILQVLEKKKVVQFLELRGLGD